MNPPGRLLGPCIAAISLAAAAVHAQQRGIPVPTGHKQLFVDDFVIGETQNLARTLHTPTKPERRDHRHPHTLGQLHYLPG
jgi:hypothetical protein